ncbi:MarR family transcriptional regulator [Atopobium sp. oral taxon 810]|uniref:MarR family winged helix-turn-helix transcriptional regulator n=1 Tax=Atopobium sp. oral taxon 810 TaxID=712158 RepID=UPI000397473D|nr:MarR family transcriptional regulator [Atopobium sp. oral taxon 810]ERI05441.1 putative organic hydroperoxide resistance transcriptional regulator [Atopobium sp. oral taxon 810 str. F0209]
MSYEQLKLENQLCFPLYAASRAITRAYKPLLDPLGLTYPQYLTLMSLWEHGDQSVSELGACLMLDSGTLTPLLKKLEVKGLIVRQRDTQDERRVVAKLTQKGRALEQQAAEIPAKMGESIPMSAAEIAKLRAMLQQMLSDLG